MLAGIFFRLLQRTLARPVWALIRVSGARRGIRTPDLLILTHYRFHGPDILTGLWSGLSLHHSSREMHLVMTKVGGVKSLHSMSTSTSSTGLPFPLARISQTSPRGVRFPRFSRLHLTSFLDQGAISSTNQLLCQLSYAGYAGWNSTNQ